MKAGDECGNTISHEIGHSMTLSHFTTGTAASWGIADEYPKTAQTSQVALGDMTVLHANLGRGTT
jgi:hypothetical protein